MDQPRTIAASRRMLIDGKWCEASNGATYAVPNPATEEIIGTAPDATVDDMQRAIGAARRAFDEGPWPRSDRHERARVLTRIADAMERRKEEMRALLVAEAGAAPLTHGIQVDQPIALLRDYAERALTFEFERSLPTRVAMGPMGPQVNSAMVVRQPAGVCALIPTWNFPMFVAVQKLGPALATGCTMVFKPSPWGPLVNLWLADLIAEAADLPPGVVNFVTGQSNAIAEAMVSDRRVDKISFTGSVGTGKRILRAAAETMARVHLELGGKSVGIYLDTDNLDLMAPMACGPALFHAGQGCAMSTRVLVPKQAHDDFVARMKGFVEGFVKVGDPADPSTILGPIIRPERRDKIEEYIASGKQEGATLATGGGRPKDLSKGWFLEPTIFCNVQNTIRIAQEEIFGPVVSVIPFADEDEAIRIANASTYGLGGAIFSRDTARALELAKRIRTGVVWVNGGLNVVDAPFGGFKESGIGREGGDYGMDEYTEVQQITWRA
jgi:acyl-CoA reductase-like NAD-dependent aldehyde dehydrogenase